MDPLRRTCSAPGLSAAPPARAIAKQGRGLHSTPSRPPPCSAPSTPSGSRLRPTVSLCKSRPSTAPGALVGGPRGQLAAFFPKDASRFGSASGKKEGEHGGVGWPHAWFAADGLQPMDSCTPVAETKGDGDAGTSWMLSTNTASASTSASSAWSRPWQAEHHLRTRSPSRRAASAPRFPVCQPHPEKVPSEELLPEAQRKIASHQNAKRVPEEFHPDILTLGISRLPPDARAGKARKAIVSTASNYWEGDNIFRNLRSSRSQLLRESVEAVHGRSNIPNDLKGRGRYIRELLEV